MYRGYFALGGTEIINSERTFSYVSKNMPAFPLRDCNDCAGLSEALGHATYQSPLQDDAPWVDQSNPATYGFYGVYPLELSGDLDDTSVSVVVESIDDGGYIGSPRAATREMRYRSLLLARDRLSLHAGITWLKAALHPAPCDSHGGTCTGATGCFYAACPEITDCWEDVANAGEGIEMGVVTPDSPFSFPIPMHSGQLTSGWFNIVPTDGLVVQWSATDDETVNEIVDYGPIISRRTNSVPNPSFTTSIAGYLYGGGVLGRVPSGGPSGGPYAHFEATGPASFRTPDLPGWFGNVTGSFELRGTPGDVVTVVIVTSEGVTIFAEPMTLTAEWQRHYIHASFGRNIYMAFETNGKSFDIDQLMLEAGTLELPYFDGSSTPPADSPLAGALASTARDPNPGHYVVSWNGPANASTSQMLWISPSTIPGTPPATQVLPLLERCDEWTANLTVLNGESTGGYLSLGYFFPITAEEQAAKYERSFHDLAITAGPTVINEYNLESGVAVEVEWTMVAATPFPLGATEQLMREPMSTAPTTPINDATIVCPVTVVAPITDPDCPPVPAAPRPPAVPNVCVDNTTLWDRYSFEIEAEKVSGWSQMLPTITLSTKAEDVRQVRVRMTPNPFSWPLAQVDPCGYCAEFILSYLPANAELTVDGTTRTAYASIAGKAAQPASHLLYGTNGTPITWPSLSCGIPYVMTVDFPSGTDPEVEVALSLTRQET